MAISFYHNHYGMLDAWSRRMNESPWRFNQFSAPDGWRNKKDTRKGVYQQRHRESLAEQLGKSFELCAKILGYFPKPIYVENEIIDLTDGVPWNQQAICVPRRHLIRIGKKKVETLSEPTVVAQTLANGIPGYKVTFSLTSEPDDFTVSSMIQSYGVSLTSGANPDRMRVSELMPIVKVSGDDYLYEFYLPAWNLVNIKERFNGLIGMPDSELGYDDDGVNGADWSSADSPVVDKSRLTFFKLSNELDGAVNLLSLPPSDSSESGVVRTPVSARITDSEMGHFTLYGSGVSFANAPYAVEVSYLSGLNLQGTGGMHSGIERAIIALANIAISDVTIPASSLASETYTKDREEITKNEGDRFYLPGQLANPLGFKHGHATAWGFLRGMADLSYGSLSRWI